MLSTRTWELTAPLTSSFSLVSLIMVSTSSCLFSSIRHRDSISWKHAGCPRFGWRLWAFSSFNQNIQKSARILIPVSQGQEQKVPGPCPLLIMAMARLRSTLTWVSEGQGQRSGREGKIGAWLEPTLRVGRGHLCSTIRALVQ